MSKYITVASLRKDFIFDVPFEKGFDYAISKVKEHWDKRFNLIKEHSCPIDLILMPERSERNESYTPEQMLLYDEYRKDKILKFFGEKAREMNTYIAYSTIWPDGDGSNRNSIVMIDRQGEILDVYDKYHTVIGEAEEFKGYAGAKPVIFNCDFGKVGGAICFDLNFDELKNMYKKEKPDLMIFSSAYHGGFVQQQWAYDLRCYFLSSIIAMENALINPVGQKIAYSTYYTKELVQTINLDCEVVHIDLNWQKIKKAREKYGDKFKIVDPGLLGVVLISSETDEFTVDDIIKEFGIIRLDDYFNNSLEAQKKVRKERMVLNPYK